MIKNEIKFILFVILMTIALNTQAQIAVSDLTLINQKIETPYYNKPAQIDGIIKSYISKGFTLSDFLSKTDNNTMSDASFKLIRVQPSGSSDVIYINTFKNDPSMQTVYTIEFNTSDFTIYSGWISTLDNTPASYTEQPNNHFEYIYKYMTSTITVGTQQLKPIASTAGAISSYEMILNPAQPMYFIRIKSNYLYMSHQQAITHAMKRRQVTKKRN